MNPLIARITAGFFFGFMSDNPITEDRTPKRLLLIFNQGHRIPTPLSQFIISEDGIQIIDENGENLETDV